MFLWSLKASFLCRTSAKTFSKSIFDKPKLWKNLNFLTKIMDYPLWKNANFAFFLNPCLYCLKTLVYERERHQIVFQGVIWLKQTVSKISTFWPKPWTNPFGKMPILGFLKRCFPCPDRLVCYIKGRRSFFPDLFSRSMTSEYRGFQGVTWGDRGLQGVTGGYKVLHGVTRGYRRLQGVTGGTKNDRKFFLTRTFPDSFSWLNLHKNRSWRNLKCLCQVMD